MFSYFGLGEDLEVCRVPGVLVRSVGRGGQDGHLATVLTEDRAGHVGHDLAGLVEVHLGHEERLSPRPTGSASPRSRPWCRPLARRRLPERSGRRRCSRACTTLNPWVGALVTCLDLTLRRCSRASGRCTERAGVAELGVGLLGALDSPGRTAGCQGTSAAGDVDLLARLRGHGILSRYRRRRGDRRGHQCRHRDGEPRSAHVHSSSIRPGHGRRVESHPRARGPCCASLRRG